MNTITTINCIQDLLDRTSAQYFAEERGRWIFRGHTKETFQLIPSVGRDEHAWSTREEYETSLFNTFCREARGHLNLASIPTNDWEWLSLAQHVGLPLACWTGHTILWLRSISLFGVILNVTDSYLLSGLS